MEFDGDLEQSFREMPRLSESDDGVNAERLGVGFRVSVVGLFGRPSGPGLVDPGL